MRSVRMSYRNLLIKTILFLRMGKKKVSPRPSLCDYCFHDTDRRLGRNDTSHLESRLGEQFVILGWCPFLPSGYDQHNNVRDLSEMRRVVFRQDEFHDQ